jgi:hypothetical protein
MTFPTDLLVSAQTRIAAEHGIPIVVRHRGDSSTGVIVLKINLLDGTARVLTQVRIDDELAWNSASPNDCMKDEDAERYLDQQIDIDPDAWVVEIEDRRGRHWFPGRVVKG